MTNVERPRHQSTVALGFFEISGVVAATNALDIMLKSASVRLVSWERKWGGRLVTIIITGAVSDVREALGAACIQGLKPPAALGILANPHAEVVRLTEKSATRIIIQKGV